MSANTSLYPPPGPRDFPAATVLRMFLDYCYFFADGKFGNGGYSEEDLFGDIHRAAQTSYGMLGMSRKDYLQWRMNRYFSPGTLVITPEGVAQVPEEADEEEDEEEDQGARIVDSDPDGIFEELRKECKILVEMVEALVRGDNAGAKALVTQLSLFLTLSQYEDTLIVDREARIFLLRFAEIASASNSLKRLGELIAGGDLKQLLPSL